MSLSMKRKNQEQILSHCHCMQYKAHTYYFGRDPETLL
jgi:hypothetical protein